VGGDGGNDGRRPDVWAGRADREITVMTAGRRAITVAGMQSVEFRVAAVTW